MPVNSVKRGVFLNTGSKDVGRDPNWENGRYVKHRAVNGRNVGPSN